MMDVKKSNIQSQYFNVFELAQGVYAVIEKENQTGSNAGIIDLGDRTVIFDTFLNIDAAKELKRISEKLTGRAASIVINSHGHADHIVGNSLFKDAMIVSSELTTSEIVKFKEQFIKEKEQYPAAIREIEAALPSKKDKREIDDMNNELLFLTNFVKEDVAIEGPNLLFKGEITIKGSKRSLILTAHDAAHSKGDVTAYLADENIIFMGDLLFAESHPWLGSGNPEKLKEILEGLYEYDARYYVPGHGRLSDKKDVQLMIQYIDEILKLVQRKGSLNVDDYSSDELSTVFSQWKGLCFRWNINFLLERIKNEGKRDEEI